MNTKRPDINADETFYAVFIYHGDVILLAEQELPYACTRSQVVADIVGGQFERVARVFCFNPAEGWARDCSEDLARECAALVEFRMEAPSWELQDFVERHAGFGLMRRAA